jgi:hypothetical protein
MPGAEYFASLLGQATRAKSSFPVDLAESADDVAGTTHRER